jgi:thiamine biosynthesis lipoprotein
VLRAGLKIYAMSGGAFDVTVGPLVNLWGFGPDKDRSPPSPDDLLRARKRVGSNLLVLNTTAGTLGKKIPDVYVDLSAIAKGYGVDEMAAALEKEGYSRYLVELGGEIRSRGAGVDGRPWQVGLETPDGGVQDVESRVQMEGESLATSGNYRNFRLVDGKRISHTMDPRSGAPVDHSLASVSVIAETCMMADGWATAMMVLGVVGGLKIADAEGLAVRFLVAEPTPGTFRVVRSRAWDTWVEKSPVLPKENSARGKDSVVDPKTE